MSARRVAFFDRKAVKVSGEKVQKIATAFANADGGEFVIGICDEKAEPNPEHRWQGAATLEELNPHLQNLFMVNPTIDIRYEILKCDSTPGYVLRVLVEKGQSVHYTSGNKVFVRYGAQSLPLDDPEKITELSLAKGATTFEDYGIASVTPDDIIDSAEICTFLDGHAPKTDPLDFVLNQNLMDGKTWTPKVAAIVLFHPNPPSVMPRKCAVKIVRYKTREDDPERDHLVETFTVEAPMYPLIHEIIKRITEIMSSIQIWTVQGLRHVKYPPEAVWEVVVNALIHRDYSISDDVQIKIFDDRIEVYSPGRLPGYVTPANILDARYSRNPKIVRTLNRYSNPPNKDLGEGLNTTFQKMKEWGLKEPIIIEEGNYVKVTLPHTPLATASEAILEFLASTPQITNHQAREITGIRSENTMKSEFYRLRDDGMLEMIPELKGSKSAWRLTEKGLQKVKKDYDA